MSNEEQVMKTKGIYKRKKANAKMPHWLMMVFFLLFHFKLVGH